MEDVKSTNIVPIGLYCILLGLYFISTALNMVLNDSKIMASADLMVWLPVAAGIVIGGGLIAVAVGVLNLDRLCWRILFFCLVINIASISSGIIADVVFLMFGVDFLRSFHVPILSQISFLAVFLSEIIVLYYLTRYDVVSAFGDMGPLLSPF
jgi:hypothetical protein